MADAYIPRFRAEREVVPGTYDPMRRPGSSGQRYFSDITYANPNMAPRVFDPEAAGYETQAAYDTRFDRSMDAAIDAARDVNRAQAAGLQALNLANPARQQRPATFLPAAETAGGMATVEANQTTGTQRFYDLLQQLTQGARQRPYGTGIASDMGTTGGTTGTTGTTGLITAQDFQGGPDATFASSGDPLLDAYRQAFYGAREGQYSTDALKDSIQAIAAQNPNIDVVDYLLNYGIDPGELYISGAGSVAGEDSALYQQLFGGQYYGPGGQGTFDIARVYKEAYDKNPDATVFDTSLNQEVGLFKQAPLGGLSTWNPNRNTYELSYIPSLAEVRDQYGLDTALKASLGMIQNAGYYSTDFDKAAEILGVPVETILAEAEKRPEYIVTSQDENFVRVYTGDPADFVPQKEGEKLSRRYLGNNKVQYFSPTSDVFQQDTNGFAQGGLASVAPKGMYLGGSTDGMADQIPATIDNRQPAALSDGEFVIPADVVSHLGNGNSDAGAKQLYGMMDRIRKARTGTTQQGKQINPNKFLA